MIVELLRGKGRRARPVKEDARGSWLFRLFMAWFARGNLRSG